MRTSNELQVGKAGEYLVCADLILKGYVSFLSEQGLPYDVLLDVGDKLFKIQVKTTEKPRTIPQRAKDSKAYIFNIKKHGKGNIQKYGANEVDIFALVCLDTRKIGYLLQEDMPDTVNFRVDSLRGSYYDEKGIIDYQNVNSLFSNGETRVNISKKLSLNYSTVSRMIDPSYKPFSTGARYFSDIERDKTWFKTI